MTRNSSVNKTIKLNNTDSKCNVTVTKHFNRPRSHSCLDRAHNFPEINVFVDNVVKELADIKAKKQKKAPKIGQNVQNNTKNNEKVVPNPKPKLVKKNPSQSTTSRTSTVSSDVSKKKPTRVRSRSLSPSNTVYINKLKDEIQSHKKSTSIQIVPINNKSKVILRMEKKRPSYDGIMMLKQIKKDVRQYSDHIRRIRGELYMLKNKHDKEHLEQVEKLKSEIEQYKGKENKCVMDNVFPGDWSGKDMVSYVTMVKKTESSEAHEETEEKERASEHWPHEEIQDLTRIREQRPISSRSTMVLESVIDTFRASVQNPSNVQTQVEFDNAMNKEIRNSATQEDQGKSLKEPDLYDSSASLDAYKEDLECTVFDAKAVIVGDSVEIKVDSKSNVIEVEEEIIEPEAQNEDLVRVDKEASIAEIEEEIVQEPQQEEQEEPEDSGADEEPLVESKSTRPHKPSSHCENEVNTNYLKEKSLIFLESVIDGSYWQRSGILRWGSRTFMVAPEWSSRTNDVCLSAIYNLCTRTASYPLLSVGSSGGVVGSPSAIYKPQNINQVNIWKPESFQFQNKPRRRNFHSKYTEMKHSIVERWRNIRDAFAKSVKKEARDSNARKYLYSEKLSFLKKYLDNRDMKGEVKPRFGVKRSYTSSEATPERVIVKKDIPTSTSSSNSTLDEDQAFFMSLLPSVKALETDQKLQFRIEVMQLIQKLKNHSAGYDYQPFA